MSGFEIPDPILNSPYDEPQKYWYLEEGQPPDNRNRPALSPAAGAVANAVKARQRREGYHSLRPGVALLRAAF
jgi:hypothetical protein